MVRTGEGDKGDWKRKNNPSKSLQLKSLGFWGVGKPDQNTNNGFVLNYYIPLLFIGMGLYLLSKCPFSTFFIFVQL